MRLFRAYDTARAHESESLAFGVAELDGDLELGPVSGSEIGVNKEARVAEIADEPDVPLAVEVYDSRRGSEEACCAALFSVGAEHDCVPKCHSPLGLSSV